jgi:hypothetical protein
MNGIFFLSDDASPDNQRQRMGCTEDETDDLAFCDSNHGNSAGAQHTTIFPVADVYINTVA